MQAATAMSNPSTQATGEFVSTPKRLLTTAQRLGEQAAYHVRSDDGWQPTSWTQYATQVQKAARALVALGVKQGDAVCILGFNRPEWTTMDLAAMMVGAVAAGIYWTSSASEVAYILEHSDCSLLLIENEHHWQKIAHLTPILNRLRAVVMMADGKTDGTPCLSWSQFTDMGEDKHQEEVTRRLTALKPTDLGTLIYTSGTTGPAKAVMLSHSNLTMASMAQCDLTDANPSDRLISYLPLAHIAEQQGAIHNHCYAGYQIFFAQKIESLGDHLKEVHPSIFFGVPRVWQKMHAAIEEKLTGATGLKVHLVAWAMRVGRAWHDTILSGKQPGMGLALQKKLAYRLIHQKVLSAIGLDQTRIALSGAAPIASETLKFFTGLDLLIGEVYGQSEVSGPTSFSILDNTKIGSVGKVVKNLQVRIADDGEILVQGSTVFMGYLKQPEATQETMDGEWLRTGDLGYLDAQDYLYVTGRKKDLLITSGGKNISPGNLEADMMNLPLVEHAVACGDGRHFLTALLSLKPDALTEFAKQSGLSGGPSDWMKHPAVIAEIQRGIDDVNSRQARVSQIRKFELLPESLTIEKGELTPTLKVKRKVIIDRHADLINSMYAD